MLPGPKSVPTKMWFWSFQSTWLLASGSSKPPLTKALVRMSNSR